MKRRSIALFLMVGFIVALAGLKVVRAANVIVLTELPAVSDIPSLIGIDWLPATNQLLVSVNYDTGLPQNFATVDRTSGSQAPWGAVAGWDQEIYFATVRPGQPGGWPAGHVYSAQGFVDTQCIAELDSSGSVLNPCFAFLPGEAKLKRGDITFDRYGVPGLNGALVVLASDDTVGPATVWTVSSTGGAATKIADLALHAEGAAVIPNDPVYGPWAGKILVGEQFQGLLEAIDPISGIHVATDVQGRNVEDIWVVPPGSDFYGADHGDARVWTASAAQWSANNLVGKILLAEEDGGHLWTIEWNGSSFVITTINDGLTGGQARQWEHITFAPANVPGISIIKLTNGADANDPNASGVPNITSGGLVTWTYKVTNTGITSVPMAEVMVTDNTTGVTPTFTSYVSGNNDASFDPGEVWLYTATGTALDLTLPPPAGVHTVANSCTAGGSQPPRTVYTNVGTAAIPGASATDPSSYCNPPPVPNVTIIKYTNGADANDPNAGGVPNISPAGTVTWTYRVTNTGQTSVPRAQVSVTDNTTGVTPTFTSEVSGNGDASFDPGEVWLYTATGTALDLTLPPPAGVHTVANSCTAGGSQPARTAYTNVGTVTIPGASATNPSSYCNPPPQSGKTFSIGPSSMEGAIKISTGDYVNGGYSFKTNFTGHVTVAASVSITGPCSNGGTGTLTFPLQTKAYSVSAGSDWIPTGDANNVLSWQGSVIASVCGGVGQLNASKGAVFTTTITGAPAGGQTTFRFKYRDPAAKGKPNTNCLDTTDPNRAKADVCGASWSQTVTDP